jgi:hypothetical protein
MKKFLVLIVLFLSTFYSCNKDEEITQKDPVIDLEYLSKDIEGYREVSDEGYVSGKANAFTCYYTPTKNIKANWIFRSCCATHFGDIVPLCKERFLSQN